MRSNVETETFGTLHDRIAAERARLPRAARSIADFVINQTDDILAMTTRQISEAIEVSEPTLVRFCRNFGFKGISDFRIALAKSAASAGADPYSEPTIRQKLQRNSAAKLRVAECARSLVAEDRTILLGAGSTLRCFAQSLFDHDPLTIMTTSLYNLLDLEDASQHKLLSTGGTLGTDSMSFTGRLAEQSLAGMSFDTAYIGSDSINIDTGLSTFNEEEAHLTRALVKAARRVVLLADTSKMSQPALHRIIPISQIDVIVTDADVSPEIQAGLREEGVILHVAHGGGRAN